MSFSDPVFEALWKRVNDAWQDDRVHGALLEHCQRTDQLAEAAARYRGMAGDREKGESARKRLGAIAILAMAKLEVDRSASAREPSQVGRLLLLLFFVAATGLMLIWLLR